MTIRTQVAPTVAVEVINGQPTTTSLDVAAHFGKQHKDVLRRINSLECSPEFAQRNFAQCSRKGANNKPEPYFRMTRDGFTFLCMGFTGKEAAKWKEAYITAFNQLEQQVAKQASAPLEHVPADEDMIMLHYNRRPLTVYRLRDTFWYRAAHLAGIVGVRDGYALTRSLPPEELLAIHEGNQKANMVSHRAMLASIGRLKREEAEALLAWLQLVIPGAFMPEPQRALPAPNPADPSSLLRGMIAGNRFMCYLDDQGRITLREIPPTAVLASVEMLPDWIADPSGPPRHILPKILQAIGQRMQ